MLSTLVTLACWAVVAVVNFWIFSKGKGQPSLFMLAGSAAMAGSIGLQLAGLLIGLTIWIQLAAIVVFTLGFVLSVKPQIEGQLAALKAKTEGLRASA